MSTENAREYVAGNERSMKIAFALTATFLVVEIIGGVLTKSLALISDAAHMLTDTTALGIALVAISIVLGAIISVPVAYARMSRNPVLSGLAYAYVYFFRGTPLLAQTFLVYYGVGSFKAELDAVGLWTFFREAFNCAIFAFSLNTAAYQAEMLRGAIESVPKGQWEGAASLGLHKIQTMWKIILPQAAIVALRPYGNEVILMVKGSAIVAIITVYDLMGITRFTYSRTFDFQSYLWAAVIYLMIVETLRHGIEWIERRLTRHLKR